MTCFSFYYIQVENTCVIVSGRNRDWDLNLLQNATINHSQRRDKNSKVQYVVIKWFETGKRFVHKLLTPL